MTKKVVPIDLFNAILAFLGTQPLNEVYPMWAALQQCSSLEEEKKAE